MNASIRLGHGEAKRRRPQVLSEVSERAVLTEIDVHRVQPVDSLPGVVRPYGLVVPDVRDSDGP